MNRILGVVTMHSKDKWIWLAVPWMILLSSFVINVIIAIITGGEPDIYTGGLASIYIYTLVGGVITLLQTFPFAIGISVRRKDFFLGTAFMAILANGISAIVLFLLSIMENNWTHGWGIHLHFFHLPYLNDGNFIEQLWIYYIFLVHMYFLGFSFSSVYRRFGKNGMFVFVTVLSLCFTCLAFLCTNNNWWGRIWHWLSDQTAFQLSLWMLPLIAVYLLFSYSLLRKAAI